MKIKELIKKCESQKIEFKKSLAERKEILKTISAFANSKGGKIFVGIEENKNGSVKEIIGMEIRGREIENLSNEIKQNTDPVIFTSINLDKLKGKTLLIIEVKESPVKPVFAKIDRIPVAFRRVGRVNQKITANELRRMISEGKEFLWDSQVCEDAILDDIDEEKVRWFLRKAKAERNLDIDPETPVEEALERLKLYKDEGLTNAAVLLFGKEPTNFFLHAKIRCARFKGTDTHDYIDMKVFENTIPQLREESLKFIMQYIKHGIFFDENRRYDRWEYPIRALEEVLSNALAHREYNTSAQTQLSIFDDRIEVWNPGELPDPLTPEDLKRKHRSIPRNPFIANGLFLIKYIEQWGKGTNRVIERLIEQQLDEPLFQNLSGGFEVIIYGPGKKFEEEIEREKFHILDINDRQKKAIVYVKEKGSITKREYMKMNKVSDKTAYLELKDLLLKDIFNRVGIGRSTRYVVK